MLQKLLRKIKLSVDDGGIIDKKLGLENITSLKKYFHMKNIIEEEEIGNYLTIEDSDLDEYTLGHLTMCRDILLEFVKKEEIKNEQSTEIRLLNSHIVIRNNLNAMRREISLRYIIDSPKGEDELLSLTYNARKKEILTVLSLKLSLKKKIKCKHVTVDEIEKIQEIFEILCERAVYNELFICDITEKDIRKRKQENLKKVTDLVS